MERSDKYSEERRKTLEGVLVSSLRRTLLESEGMVQHRCGRSSQYRTYIKTLKNRLKYVDDKEAEWKRRNPDVQPASYYKTERDTLKWVLELIECFIPEHRRPEGAPIPVIADECPKCHMATIRPFDGLKRIDPWKCRSCGHEYSLPENSTSS